MIEFVQHGLVDGDGRVEPMDGSRAGVEQVGNGIELLLAVHGQVRALGQVLADQSVGVLAGAPLPRAVRVTEVHHHTRVGCQLSVARHLLALIVGQRRIGNSTTFPEVFQHLPPIVNRNFPPGSSDLSWNPCLFP